MTPEEKAWDLFEQHTEQLLDVGIYRDDVKSNALRCALITVKEILKAREAGTTGVIFDKAFWEETESELNLL